MPPPTELHYDVIAKKNNLHITGQALIHWYYKENIYKISTEIRVVIIGKILETSSEGTIVNFGLAPERFIEKRLKQEKTMIIFNRKYNNLYFTCSNTNYILQNTEQDCTSIILQLVAVARDNFSKFINGSTWVFLVASNNKVEQWCFTIVGREKIKTSFREFNTVHLLYNVSFKDRGSKLDIWLAPSEEWYPIRLRFTYPNGNFVEQILNNIIKYPH